VKVLVVLTYFWQLYVKFLLAFWTAFLIKIGTIKTALHDLYWMTFLPLSTVELLQFTFSDHFHNPCFLFQLFPFIVYSVDLKKNGNKTASLVIRWIVSCGFRSEEVKRQALIYCGILFVIARGPLMLYSRVVFSFKQNFQHWSVYMIKCLLTELGWVGRERNKRKFQTFTCYKS